MNVPVSSSDSWNNCRLLLPSRMEPSCPPAPCLLIHPLLAAFLSVSLLHTLQMFSWDYLQNKLHPLKSSCQGLLRWEPKWKHLTRNTLPMTEKYIHCLAPIWALTNTVNPGLPDTAALFTQGFWRLKMHVIQIEMCHKCKKHTIDFKDNTKKIFNVSLMTFHIYYILKW